ncbi:MAG: molybdopterin-binding protein, partial [Desulfohalobiaceae bacterium]
MLKVEIAATGNELINGQIADTNSPWIAEQLRIIGAGASRIHTVGDEADALGDLLREIASRTHLALVTGGLGSTPDDITLRAAADCSGRRLIADGEAKSSVAGVARERSDSVSQRTAAKQALIPEKSTVLPNPLGTAPGFCLSLNGCL